MGNPSRIQVLRSRRRRLLLDAEGGGSAFTHTLTVAALSTYRGKYAGAAGSIDPTTFEGEEVYHCMCNTSGGTLNQFTLAFGAGGTTQIGAATTVTLTIDDQDPVICTWDGTWYQSTAHAVQAAYLSAALGTDVSILLEAA